jgi:hypothetical protein
MRKIAAVTPEDRALVNRLWRPTLQRPDRIAMGVIDLCNGNAKRPRVIR